MVSRDRLHGKDNIGVRVGKVINKYKMAKHYVLLIEDIYDTCHTLKALLGSIGKCNPRILRTCVLLEKVRPHEVPCNIVFVGFQMPDEFLIGYGLDYQERYRELPFIAVLSEDQK